MSTWDQYQIAFKAADETTKNKLRSSLITECVESAVTKYELDESHVRILIKIFADEILQIITAEEAITNIRNAAIPAAAVLHTEISSCLNTTQPSVEDLSQKISDDYQTDEIRDEEFEELIVAPTNDNLAAELAETEAAFKQLQPIRTMAHDMETLRTDDTSTYKSTDQETILNGQGNAGKNTAAQWGTPEK